VGPTTVVTGGVLELLVEELNAEEFLWLVWVIGDLIRWLLTSLARTGWMGSSTGVFIWWESGMLSISIMELAGLGALVASTSIIDSVGLGTLSLCLVDPLLKDRDCLTSITLSVGLTGLMVMPAGSTGCLNAAGLLGDLKLIGSGISTLGGESAMSTAGGEPVMSTIPGPGLSFSGSDTWLTVDTEELSLPLETEGRVATARA